MRPTLFAKYLGLNLSSPVIVGSCPLTLSPETVRELAIAGAGAVVLPPLFEEQILERQGDLGLNLASEFDSDLSLEDATMEDQFNGGPVRYLRTIELLKRTTSVPIIASLDGSTAGRWLSFAAALEASGVDAVELNLHREFIDASMSGEEVEASLLNCVRAVRDYVTIPVSVKLLPFYTSLANLAQRLQEAGAAGIVIFGREPKWIVMPDELRATTEWSLSPAGNIDATISGLIRARHGVADLSIAASGGISSPAEVAKVILAGGDVAMVASEVQREGPLAVSHMVEGLISFLDRNHYHSFEEFTRARPQPVVAFSSRLSYLEPLTHPNRYSDPSPAIPARTGDRWGHPDNGTSPRDGHR